MKQNRSTLSPYKVQKNLKLLDYKFKKRDIKDFLICLKISDFLPEIDKKFKKRWEKLDSLLP